MHSRKLTGIIASLVALVLAVLTVACDQGVPTQPAAEATALTPMLNFTNNLDNGNDRIFRTETSAGFGIFDPNSSMLAILSTVDFCDIGQVHTVSIQEIFENPDEPLAGQIRLLMKAKDINMWILDNSTYPNGDCLGRDLIASGVGSVVQTDNDEFILLRDTNNKNSFGATGHGKLMTVDGERFHYNATIRIVWDGDDFSTMKINEHFNVRSLGGD